MVLCVVLTSHLHYIYLKQCVYKSLLFYLGATRDKRFLQNCENHATARTSSTANPCLKFSISKQVVPENCQYLRSRWSIPLLEEKKFKNRDGIIGLKFRFRKHLYYFFLRFILFSNYHSIIKSTHTQRMLYFNQVEWIHSSNYRS